MIEEENHVNPNPFRTVFLEPIKLGTAMREAWAEGYNKKSLIADLQAGIVVGFVALPLSMALAVASGVAPQYGLYTVIIGGLIVALLGGSRYQITGPTAAFVVLLLPVVQKFGIAGLLVAGILSGIMLILMGFMRLGDVIQYVPHPVTTGFTSGIAVVIATLQIKDFLGLKLTSASAHFLVRMKELAAAIPSVNPVEAAVGAFTLIVLITSFRRIKAVPAPIIALSFATLASYFVEAFFPDIHIETIASRFAPGIPQMPPVPLIPWKIADAFARDFHWTPENFEAILPAAFAIAMLGAIESLLSATIADGMSQKTHSPNTELIALGIGNVICPFFGGIPATGAIARTATNIRFGAVSPISAVIHSVLVLLVVVSLSPIVSFVPMASLAALLLFVSYNMAERHNFTNILRIGTREDRLVLLCCFTLTVIFDMTVGVGVGVVLAALLFVRRLAMATKGQILQDLKRVSQGHTRDLPKQILYYKITGTMFFGAANRAMQALGQITGSSVRWVVLDLTDVQILDITALVAFDSAVSRIFRSKIKLGLVTGKSGTTKQEICKLGTFCQDRPDVKFFSTTDDAFDFAEADLGLTGTAESPAGAGSTTRASS